MRKEFILGGLGVVLVLIVSLFIVNRVKYIKTLELQIETVNQQLASKDQLLADYGTVVDTYTVNTAVTAGSDFDASYIEKQQTPVNLITDQYITDMEAVQEFVYKLDVTPGTPLTYDLFIEENLNDSDRYYDVVVDQFPLSPSRGDYYDIRLVTPDGKDYVVLSKKRVIGFYNTAARFIMSEDEILTYQSALVDCFLSPGTKLYATLYVEPSLQEAAIPFYPIRDNINFLRQVDPNASGINFVQSAYADLENRRLIYNAYKTLTEDEIEAIIAGRMAEAALINDASEYAIENQIKTTDEYESVEDTVEEEAANDLMSNSVNVDSPESGGGSTGSLSGGVSSSNEGGSTTDVLGGGE